MSVIASNSVNFVPIYQLLKSFSDTKPKEVAQNQQFEKISGNIFPVADVPVLNKMEQSVQVNPISSVQLLAQEKVLDEKLLKIQEVLQNADSLKLFIVDSKEKAMSQQANQSKQKAMFLM